MNFRTIAYFFTKTANAFRKGTRFLDGDRPNETTFKDLFYSILWRTESTHRAKEDTGSFIAENNGHVVMATAEQAQQRVSQPDDRTLAVAPAQLPHVVAEEGIGVTTNTDNGNNEYHISASGIRINDTDSTYSLKLADKIIAGENVTLEVDETDPEDFKLKIVAESGLLADVADTTPSFFLSEKLVVGTGLVLAVDNTTPENHKLKLSVAPPSDLPVFYIDSNNTEPGDGSILNPFQTVEKFITRLDGNLPELGGKITTRVTAVVRGGTYTATANWWRGVNYVFEQGVVVNVDLSSSYLFDGDGFVGSPGGEILNGVTSYPNVYGQANFVLSNVGLYRNHTISYSSNNIPTKIQTFAFASISGTTNSNSVIELIGTGYTNSGGTNLTTHFVGNNTGRKGTLECYTQNFLVSASLSDTASLFTFTNVAFLDTYNPAGAPVTNPKTAPSIRIAGCRYGVTFSSCTFSHRAVAFGAAFAQTGGFFRLEGSVAGLTLENCQFFHGNSYGFICFVMAGTVSDFIRLDNVSYIHSGLINSSNKFVYEEGTGNFTADHTTVVSYGGVYNSSSVEYTEVSPFINTKFDFTKGGAVTLKGKTYLGVNVTV